MTTYPSYTLNSHRQSIEETILRIEDYGEELQRVETDILYLSAEVVRCNSEVRQIWDSLCLAQNQRRLIQEFNTQEHWAFENELDQQFKAQSQESKSAELDAKLRVDRAARLRAEIRQLQDEVRLKRAMESDGLAGRDRMFVEITISIMLRVKELRELQGKADIQELKIVQLQHEIAELEALQDQALQGA